MSGLIPDRIARKMLSAALIHFVCLVVGQVKLVRANFFGHSLFRGSVEGLLLSVYHLSFCLA